MPKLSPQLQTDLARVLSDAIAETFNTLFNVEISSEMLDAARRADAPIICKTIFHQQDVHGVLAFSFDRKLLEQLLKDIYPVEMLTDETTFCDAACEITNITCGYVKEFLNQQGYSLTMELPYTRADDKSEPESERPCFHLHFTHNKNAFAVGFGLNDNRSKEQV